LEWMPDFARAGYSQKLHAQERKVYFPATRSSIIGEIGDNIGRGGRTALYGVDETAWLEHGLVVDAALANNTMCRLDLSSVHGMDNSFAQRAHDPKVRKFIFAWQHDPRKDMAWYEKYLETWGPVITAQEVDRNYQASVEGVVIPAEYVEAMVDAHIHLQLDMTGERRGAFDVADKGADKNAFVGGCGNLVTMAKSWSGQATGDIFASVQKVFGLLDDINAREFSYDADGLGAGVEGDARVLNEERRKARRHTIHAHAHRGSAAVLFPKQEMVEGRRNEDFFENRKAQVWWSLRQRAQATYRARKAMKFDPDDIISIDSKLPELAQLKIELSQPQYDKAKSGKLLIKKAPDGSASPNLADAFCIYFAPRSMPFKISDAYLARSRALADQT
ncbi:MAG: hypothetical protein WCB02_21820, partial [Bradyrhizobium sp.]